MTLFALYVPKPADLYPHIAILLILFGVFYTLIHELKFYAPIAAILMLLGCAIALALDPDLLAAVHKDLGEYGDMAREQSGTNYSDTFWGITSYMHVGRGSYVALVGMLIGFVLHTAIIGVWKLWRRSLNDPRKAERSRISRENTE